MTSLSTGQPPWGCLAEDNAYTTGASYRKILELSLNSLKRRPSQADFGREALWLRIATFVPQVQNDSSRSSPVLSCIPGNKIQSLCQQGQLDKAMDVLLHMEQQGLVPSVEMYRSLLKACTKRKDLVQVKRVHAHLARHGLESAKFLSDDVVNTYVKCGSLEEALQVFYRLPHRNAYCWTAVISGYTYAGQHLKALGSYQLMQQEDVQPNAYTLVSLLKACGSMANLQEGKRIHAEAFKYGYESDLFVGTCLVNMYSKCGSIADAQAVFERLSERDVVSWTAMLMAFVEQDQAENAMQLYEQMLDEGVSPNDRTFVIALQACGMLAEREAVMVDGLSAKVNSLKKGRALHADTWMKGYCSDLFVVSALLSMYGKCGSIMDAQNVFDAVSLLDVVSWNVMLTAYIEHNFPEKALQVYETMLHGGVSPDNCTFVTTLQACAMLAEKEANVMFEGKCTKVESLGTGKAIHSIICRKGYNQDIFVENTLVSMYGKCGSILDAWNVFCRMSYPDVVSWNVILAAYVEHSMAEEALELYEDMCENGVSPDARTFVSALQACGLVAEEDALLHRASTNVDCLVKGEAIHSDALKKGYGSDIFIGNTLVSMYGKCGSTVHAQRVFDGLSQRDVVSWNAMLAVYVELDQPEKALELYEQMQQESVSPYCRTFVSVFQSCGMLAENEEDAMMDGQCIKLKALTKGKAMHAAIQRNGYNPDFFVESTLISMYGKCGSILDARSTFDRLPQLTVVSWNAMLAALVEQGHAQTAFLLYDSIREEGLSPDAWTFVSTLQACGNLAESEDDVIVNGQRTKVEFLEKGKVLHCDLCRKCYDSDGFIGSTLISMFGKCWSLVDALNVFHGLSHRNVVSWNAMLTAYVEQDQAEEALQLYLQMQEESTSPDICTFVSILQACGVLGDKEDYVVVDGRSLRAKSFEKGKVIHADICKRGYAADVFINNTLISMYGKCGSIADAWNSFSAVSERNISSWNAMLGAYGEQGETEQAIKLYKRMQKEGASPNEITLVCIAQACSHTGSLDSLKQIHHRLVSTGAAPGTVLSNALISAYGRCGSLVDAQNAFDSMPKPDVMSWNGLIAAYSRQGDCTGSLQCFQDMRLAGFLPDRVTFLALLSACSHAGLVDQGAEYFESMSREYGITPEIEHYIGMVDLFGRAGCFPRVAELLSTMPMQPNLVMWLCLMGACRKHGELALGRHVFDCAVRLHPQNSAAYVLMANIYADAGLLKHADKLRTCETKGKSMEHTWSDLDRAQADDTHFLVGDWEHAEHEQVCSEGEHQARASN